MLSLFLLPLSHTHTTPTACVSSIIIFFKKRKEKEKKKTEAKIIVVIREATDTCLFVFSFSSFLSPTFLSSVSLALRSQTLSLSRFEGRISYCLLSNEVDRIWRQ
uniref:Uncharacterized protein n=1 Tax=Salix viminalis TaxID=40686 RepID=A0A6N2MB66_SALVM